MSAEKNVAHVVECRKRFWQRFRNRIVNIIEYIAKHSRIISLLVSPLISVGIGILFEFNSKQLVALAAFVFSILGAFFFWKYKLIVAFASVTMLLTLGVIDVSTLIESSEFDIILFLIAMTLIIAPLKRVGFFRWLTLFLLKISNFNIKVLVMLFMATSMILAGIMGAVSSIVVITAMVMEFSDYFEIDSKLFIILSILASNIGSSATALGNPVGLILALGADLSFEEFLRWSAPLAFLSIAIVILYIMKVHGSFLDEVQLKINKGLRERKITLNLWSVIGDLKKFFLASFIFIITIISLSLHRLFASFLSLEGKTMLVGLAFLGAALALTLYKEEGKEIVEKEVDWWSLLFITFLFGETGALKYTGVTNRLAYQLLHFTHGNISSILLIISISVFFLSAFLDNVPTVAAFIPIVLDFRMAGLNIYPIWWIILISGCYAGNLTPLASAANMVALGILEKRKINISLREWLYVSFIPTIIVYIISISLLYIQFFIL